MIYQQFVFNLLIVPALKWLIVWLICVNPHSKWHSTTDRISRIGWHQHLRHGVEFGPPHLPHPLLPEVSHSLFWMNTPPLSKGRNNSVRSAKLNLLFVSGPQAERLCPEAGSAGTVRLWSIPEKRQSQRTPRFSALFTHACCALGPTGIKKEPTFAHFME